MLHLSLVQLQKLGWCYPSVCSFFCIQFHSVLESVSWLHAMHQFSWKLLQSRIQVVMLWIVNWIVLISLSWEVDLFCFLFLSYPSWVCILISVSVAKPLVADGSAKSHELSLAYDQQSLQKLEPPLVLQEFVNHGI